MTGLASLPRIGDTPPRNALPAEPLSEAMEGVGLRSWVPGPFHLTAPWGIRAGGHLGWCYLLTFGECHMEVEDDDSDTLLQAGDLVIVPQGRVHRLRDRQDSPLDDIESLLQPRHYEARDPMIHGGGGARTSVACISFLLENHSKSPLLGALPPRLCVKGEQGRPATYVDQIFRHMTQELESGQHCTQMIVNCLLRILLIKAIYRHAAQFTDHQSGWLRAVFDPAIGQAMALMHGHPEVSWTVASLAEEVAMSRSAFAARFGALLGKPPLEYLTEWRMHRACVLLTTGHAGLKEIAVQVGYDSAAGFSKAFTKWAGTSPKTYRGQMRAASHHHPLPPILK